MDFQWVNSLTFKGYYVLPEYTGDSSSLSEKAQLLIKAEIVSNSDSTDRFTASLAGIPRYSETQMNIQFIDKKSGKVIEEIQTKGDKFQLSVQAIAESGSNLAMGEAINEALTNLPKIE